MLQTIRSSPCFALNILTEPNGLTKDHSCPPCSSVCQPYYKQTVPAGRTVTCVGSRSIQPGPAAVAGVRFWGICTSTAGRTLQPKFASNTVPAAGSAFVPGAALLLLRPCIISQLMCSQVLCSLFTETPRISRTASPKPLRDNVVAMSMLSPCVRECGLASGGHDTSLTPTT